MDYFLPHIGENNFKEKAYYLGYMVFELLKVYLETKKPTDRDSFKFKRVELAGNINLWFISRILYITTKAYLSKNR